MRSSRQFEKFPPLALHYFKVNWFVDFIANRQRLSLVLWNVFHPLPQGEVWSRLTEIQVGSMFLSSRSLNQIVHYGIPVHQSILNRSLYATTYAQGAIVLSVHVTYLLAGISLSSHTTNFHVCMFVSSASAATRTYLI